MNDWFEVSIEPKAGLLRMTMGGFFSIEGVERLTGALADARKSLGCAPNAHITLCDIRAMTIQSQDVMGHFMRLLSDPKTTSRRLALVVGTPLARMQARRLTDRPGVAFFTDMDEARRWLCEPPVSTQAARPAA